jgi:hypothetical protein
MERFRKSQRGNYEAGVVHNYQLETGQYWNVYMHRRDHSRQSRTIGEPWLWRARSSKKDPEHQFGLCKDQILGRPDKPSHRLTHMICRR